MSLKFDGTLIGAADIGDWDSETDVGAIGTIKNTTPLKGSEYYYSVADVTGSDPTYFIEDITGLGFETHWGKFRFRMPNVNFINSSKLCSLIYGYRGANLDFRLGFQTESGGLMETLLLTYRTAGGLVNDTSIDASAVITWANDTIYEIEYQYKSASPDAADGFIKVWATDIDASGSQLLLGELTGLATINANKLTELRFGWASDQIQTRTIDVGAALFSTNGNYTDEAETYWIDSTSGAETNAGTESAPFATAYQANNSAKAGDTVQLSDRTSTTPHRLMDMGQIDLIAAGSAGSLITVDGDKQTLTCTKDYSDITWVDSETNDEWYVDVSDTGDFDPNRIYVCTRDAWTTGGMAVLDRDSIRLAATKGSLTAGSYDYDSGNERVYYKAAAGETLDATMSTLHIEIPSRLAGNDDCVLVDTAYQHVKNLTIFGAVGSSLVDTTTSAGSVIDNVTSTESWDNGIAIADATAKNCTASWTRNTGKTGILISSAGHAINCTAHNNNNDGIAFNGATGTGVGNLCFHNGYEDTGDQCGIEVTGVSTVTLSNNTCVGNSGSGILNQATDITANAITNNLCAFNGETNGGYGIKIGEGATNGNTYAEAKAICANNACYGDSSFAFYFANPSDALVVGVSGSQEITSVTNSVITDPLFTNASTSTAFPLASARLDEDYSLLSASPCVGTASKWWTGANPVGRNGEPFSDWDTDYGDIQSTFSPFHPFNL